MHTELQPRPPLTIDVPEDAGPLEPPMRPLAPEVIAHQWKPGQSGNPSGKKPLSKCGRQAALSLLDEILSEHETKARMRQALRAYILQRPVAAFKTLVMPLLPKDVRVDVASQRVVVWRSFMDEVGVTTVECPHVEPPRLLQRGPSPSSPNSPALPPPPQPTDPQTDHR